MKIDIDLTTLTDNELLALSSDVANESFRRKNQIGSVSVDSGTLMLIDPCYIRHWNIGNHPDLSMDGYRRAWKEGRKQLYFSNGIPAAVFIKGFGGDGQYPVTADHNKKDVIKNLTVHFNDD